MSMGSSVRFGFRRPCFSPVPLCGRPRVAIFPLFRSAAPCVGTGGWADSNKPGRSAFTRVGDLSGIDYFITNRPLSEEWAACFAAKGTTVVIGDKEENAPADLPD